MQLFSFDCSSLKFDPRKLAFDRLEGKRLSVGSAALTAPGARLEGERWSAKPEVAGGAAAARLE